MAMIEQQILKEKFQTAHKGWRAARLHLCFLIVYMLAAAVCLAIGWNMSSITWMTGRAPWWVLLVPVPIAGLLVVWYTRHLRQRKAVARALEGRFQDLDGLLITAEGLLDKPELNVLEERVISQATDHGASHDWTATLTRSQGRPLRWGMFLGLLLWINAFLFMNHRWTTAHAWPESNQMSVGEAKPDAVVLTATVTPGDTEIERGSRLIVEARFDQQVPAEATLVVTELDGQERERLPMRLTIDEQVFGGLITRVDKDARYRVEFGTDKTQDFNITTFVYPALEHADVKITPPAYTKLPVKEIKNTLKVTAMEHSDLEFTFKINKPVKDAELFGEDRTVVPLEPSANDPTVLTASMKAEKTQKWRLHLVDEKERSNKNPPWISVKVQENQLAKIEVVFPKRDIQVSAIQELPVEAKVWDDLGVTQSGVSFSIAGKSKEVVFKHGTTQPARKQDVKELLALEHESAEPQQLVSYHFWAEDKGPQGEVRRAMSDMFFADVRHFEDIFREGESQPGKPEKEDDLLKLQKDVVNATWKLMRDTNSGRTMQASGQDVSVVHESQQVVLNKTKEAMEKAGDAEVKTALTEAWKSMKDALDPLQLAASEKKRASLNQAITFEQSALEWLHRAVSRLHQVMRSNKPSEPMSASEQAKQNQIMNLELKQQEQRYEEEKQATEEQTAEQQENLQVLNRLKELARRQEALAEKMKELQKQIEKAKTEEEKQELANQLKRLQDEQDQLLRDVDDLKERMESSDNATNMAESKEQLEQTREQVMDAAEKLKEQQLADAANAATRAQRNLEKMQEDFKQKTAKRFTDEMKQVRQQAREVAEKQKQISEALENQKTPASDRRDTSASLEKMLDGSQTSRQIEEQSTKVSELLENMRRISEQAEGNNPLLHRRLYEAVRDAQTGGLEQNLEEARMQSRYGNRSEAQDAERKATTSVEQLQKGVEKAAESVLGSETESLRMARAELDKLIEEVKGESKGQEANGQEAGEKNAKAPGQAGDETTKDKATAQKGGGKPDSEGKDGKAALATDSKAQTAGNSPEGDKPGQGQMPVPGNGNESSEQQPRQGPPGPTAQNQPGQNPQSPGMKGQEGQQPGPPSPSGEGQSQGQAQGGQEEQQPGHQMTQGEGQQAGQQPSSNPSQSQSGQGQAPGQQSGSTPGQNATAGNDRPSPNRQGGQPQPPGSRNMAGGASSGGGAASRNLGGDDRRQGLLPNGGAFFFDEGAEQVDRSPLTGAGYEQWSDRLRNVEELLNQPELRNEAAKVLDNARALRVDRERNNMAPQAENLEMRITQPLVELRNRVAEELAKRDTNNPMVPVDRDPVPPAFRELVKRYYKELGNGN